MSKMDAGNPPFQKLLNYEWKHCPGPAISEGRQGLWRTGGSPQPLVLPCCFLLCDSHILRSGTDAPVIIGNG